MDFYTDSIIRIIFHYHNNLAGLRRAGQQLKLHDIKVNTNNAALDLLKIHSGDGSRLTKGVTVIIDVVNPTAQHEAQIGPSIVEGS